MQLVKMHENQSSCFPDTLRYCSPANGGWGVVRMGMLVPESYQLFICPFACGRHGAIGALMQGYKDRLSYLYIDECDIVSGSYEQIICQAVDELIHEVKHTFKALMIFVSCLDDLLGTDHEAFLNTLREKYQGIKFTVCHMNPITLDSKCPPPVNIQRKIFGLLEKSPEPADEKAAAFIGNNITIDRESEIYQVLKAAGYSKIYHISDFNTFADFQKMSGVSLNVVTSPIGVLAAKDVKKRLGIDYVYVPLTYDYSQIEENYQTILKMSGENVNLSDYIKSTKEAVSFTKKILGDMPVTIDTSATVRPFTLAKFLYVSGINVKEIYAQECIALEKDSFKWICDNAPDIKIIQPSHPNNPRIRQYDSECLSIGFEGAYSKGARYVVNIVNDETLYGYHGIEKLMEMINSALKQKADLYSLIHEYGLVI